MVATEDQPRKQQVREFARWKRILALLEAGLSRDELALVENIGPEQVRRLIHAATAARDKGWI